jgi:hypothetical protein
MLELNSTFIQARFSHRRLTLLTVAGAAALVVMFIVAWVNGAHDVLDSSRYLTRVDIQGGLRLP